ncbi:MAG: response regulator [Archangium sp.]|nr:response regulator [Archangium sp.]
MTKNAHGFPSGPFWMVDDEPELVRATVGMLGRELGASQIRGSTDSREVLAWIERERPAALITDVRMPHLNGLELVTRLHERWGAVPVVVMTAYPTAQVDQETRAGRFAYLPKPFTFQSLRETLTRVCAQPAPSAFSGAIAVTMLGEVVQLYGLANRTGTLRVDSDSGVGEIGFDRGRVVHAVAAGAQGIDAFNTILSWTSGSFSWIQRAPGESTIHLGLSELLLEAYRLRDERDAGIAPSASADDVSIDDALLDGLDAEATIVEKGFAPSTSNVRDNLTKLELADGFLGAALFDLESNTCVAAVDHPPGRDVAVAISGHADLVMAKQQTISRLELDDELEDIVISLGREYHLLRLCRRQPSYFFFLKLDRAKANLAMARYLLSDVERDIVL